MPFDIGNFSLDIKDLQTRAKGGIVTDGLVLHLDAAYKNSYPGGGTIWYDLSGNGYDVVLQNGPIFESNYFKFDGTDDRGYLKTLNYGNGNTLPEMSVFAWVRTTYNSGTDGVWSNSNWSILDFDRSEVFTFAVNDAGEIQMSGASANSGGFGSFYDLVGNTKINDGEWHHIGWTFSVTSQKIIMYIDGWVDATFTADGNMSPLGNGVTRYGIVGDGSEAGTEGASGNGIYYDGDIGNLTFYNKELSPDEVWQNYENTKNRFTWEQQPSIVTDGLVLHLDSGNTSSYPGSGTTWYDLSGNSNSGTLTNGPTYSSVNGGSIVFDGVNDYVNIASNLGIASNIACTLDFILKVDTNTSTIVENPIIRIGTETTNQMRLLFMRSGNFAISYFANDYTFNYTVSINTIYNVTFIENGSGLVSLYINGVLQDSSSITAPNTSGNSTYIGRYSNNTFFNGDIYNVKIYNRALSSTEITQNYNALKGRYGL